MRAFYAIYLREVKAYFHSPIAYVVMAGFLIVAGWFFYNGVAIYAMISMQAMQNPMMAQLNLQQMLVGPLQANMAVVLLFIVPLLTMRLLAEEKRSGTIEVLLSYPVTDGSVVLAKFFAAMTVMALVLALTWLQWLILGILGKIYLPALLSGYLGLILISASFVSLGIFTSALSENQIVAAFLGFAGLLLLWALGWSSQVVNPDTGQLLEALSISNHFSNFPRGILDTRDLVYHILFIAFFLFISVRVLEAKRWKA